MRIYSTVQSALKLEISALAILETCAAVGLSVLMAIFIFNSWRCVHVAVIIAPFLLLQTERSRELGQKWLAIGTDRFENSTLPEPVIGVLAHLFFLLASLSIRIAATLACVLSHPLNSIKTIPGNYFHHVLCVDSMHPPELVPGAESSSISDELPLWTGYGIVSLEMAVFDRHRMWIVRVFDIVLTAIFILPPFILSIFYRLSLKATALVWLPLLWIVPKFNPASSLGVRLKLVCKSSWAKMIVILSTITLVGFFTKILIYNGTLALSVLIPNGVVSDLVTIYVAPTIMPWWQIGSACNSLIAIGLFFWAEQVLIKLEDKEYPTSTGLADSLLRTMSVIRAILSLYTIACLFYLTLGFAALLKFPPLGDKLVPWL